MCLYLYMCVWDRSFKKGQVCVILCLEIERDKAQVCYLFQLVWLKVVYTPRFHGSSTDVSNLYYQYQRNMRLNREDWLKKVQTRSTFKVIILKFKRWGTLGNTLMSKEDKHSGKLTRTGQEKWQAKHRIIIILGWSWMNTEICFKKGYIVLVLNKCW